ncbi:MAG: ATP-binding protein [Acidobacteria bacterium]|nr:ATP-binding protein [Acidobacteriota bacterium]
MDYEKLGLFYLGKQYDIQARARTDVPVLYDSSDLVTHAVIVGMTGSGKTGLGIDLMEEAAIDGIPVLAVDPKGDLANMLLTFPGLSGAEFMPWVNQDEARAAGQTPEAYGAAEAAKWARGLAEWGQDGERIKRLEAAADFVVYTPGSTMGRPVSIVKSFAAPAASVVDDPDLLGDRVSTAATSVLTLAGVDAEPLRSREHVLVSTLFAEAWKAGRDMDLAGLIAAVQNPPIETIGVMDLEAFFPAKDRFALAMQLNQLLAAPSFAAWLQGDPLDIDAMLYTPEGRPRVTVVSIAHLDDHERMFLVSLLLNELVAWMRAQRGTSSLRALVYFDEIFGFLPPVANPPSKPPLLKLLKQARAFGVGLTLATQNPVDLDYKALSNCGTWMLGRLQTERDKARVLDGLEGVAASSGEGFDRAALDSLLSSLGKRIFLLHNVHEKHPVVFETRWTMSYLRGPMGRDEVRRLCGSADADAGGADTGPAAPSVAPAPSAAPSASTIPVLDPQIKQFFLGASAGSVLSPSVFGVARVAYSDAKLGIDETRDVALVTPIADGAVAVDWEHAEPAAFDVDDLEARPPAGVTFAPLPATAARARSYTAWEKDFARWAGQTQAIELLRSPRTKLTSEPDESERTFRIRVTEAMHEERDAAREKVRAKHAARIRTAEDKVRRAQAAVERESQQAAESKVSTAVSFGATVLGALLGRKAVSAGTLGRATTAARGMGRMSREAADVARAEANVEVLTQQLADVQTALEAEMRAVGEQWDPATEELERVVVKPKRGGVSVQVLGLVWQAR